MHRPATILALVTVGLLLDPAPADEVKVSHCFQGDSTAAINDRVEPQSPVDRPRHSFWPHKGTEEWVEYRFDQPRRVSATEVYWLDDTPGGGCPLPESWRLFYRDADRWTPVSSAGPFGVEKGVFNRVTFDPVLTDGLRIEVRSRPGWSCGIIEWDVRDDPQLVEARQMKRRLATLGQFKFEPPRAGLLALLDRTGGLSPQAEAYFSELAGFKQQCDEFKGQLAGGQIPNQREIEAHLEQARQFLRGQVRRLGPIAFFTRHPLARPNAANCYIWQSVPERWGCSIRVYDPSSPEASPKVIFEDPDGSIFDMDLSYDAATVFFSYRKRDEPCWRIWEIGVDGRGLKKISRPSQFHEVGAAELADGDLVFVSTRRGGYTLCQPGMFWQARPVPGRGNLVVATFAPHHGWPHGAIGLVQNYLGLEAPRDSGFAWITQEFPQIGDHSFRWSYRDPLPVNEYQFLAAYGGGESGAGRFGLYLLDLCDNRVPVWSDAEMGCYGPLLVRPRGAPPLVAPLDVPSRSADDSVAWGSVLLADVYKGLAGIQRGRVKYIQTFDTSPL